MMAKRIIIEATVVRAEALLNDSASADALWNALPLEGKANVWGEEIYFDIPLAADEASDARQEMEIGEIAFWPPGAAFCIFFGPTPVSRGAKPRAYSPVNLLGRIVGDARVFKKVKDGTTVKISRSMS